MSNEEPKIFEGYVIDGLKATEHEANGRRITGYEKDDLALQAGALWDNVDPEQTTTPKMDKAKALKGEIGRAIKNPDPFSLVIIIPGAIQMISGALSTLSGWRTMTSAIKKGADAKKVMRATSPAVLAQKGKVASNAAAAGVIIDDAQNKADELSDAELQLYDGKAKMRNGASNVLFGAGAVAGGVGYSVLMRRMTGQDGPDR